MDISQEQMEFLSLFGIYKEAYKIISSPKKIFFHITICLLLPLSFLLLAEVKASNVNLFALKIIIHNGVNERYGLLPNTATCKKPSYSFLSDMINSWPFKIGYYTLLLVFSSFSTAAVVYTTACAYIGQQEATFKEVKSVVYKVWKRPMITTLCSYVSIIIWIDIFRFVLEWILFFPHNLCYSLLSFWCQKIAVSYTHNNHHTHQWSNHIQNWLRSGFTSVWILLFLSGLVYISIIWQMAGVVSIIEEERNVIRAMMKSKALIKGKIWINATITLSMSLLVLFTRGEYEKLFAHGSLVEMVGEVPFGILCFWFLCQLILFGLTVQTVTYFVCKSHHHEIIDPSVLFSNLQVHPHDL